MGCYINPPGESKESFLMREGRSIRPSEAVITDSELPVCLVDNGPFRAAAIGYNNAEVRAFSDPTDLRLKVWFMVKREVLMAVSDLEHYTERK